MSPPIRNKQHQRKLKAALAGGALQLIATDHCPFNSTQKAAGKNTDFRDIPNGVNGIEERLHMTWEELVNTGMLSRGHAKMLHIAAQIEVRACRDLRWRAGLVTPSGFVQLVSTAAAQIFNIYPRKGRVAAGSDADIIVLDPTIEHTISAAHHHSNIDTNIYEGRKVKGKVGSSNSLACPKDIQFGLDLPMMSSLPGVSHSHKHCSASEILLQAGE